MKKIIIVAVGLLICASIWVMNQEKEEMNTKELAGTIIAKNKNQITVLDNENVIYTFNTSEINEPIGENIILTYTGILNKNTEVQENEIIKYTIAEESEINWKETDLFAAFYEKAKSKLETMSLDEKIGQVLLIRYDEAKKENLIKNYMPAGLVFYEKDFQNKTQEEVKKMTTEAKNLAKTPLLTAVDEEGGKIVRISSNANLVSSPFKSSSELFLEGGLDLIRQDTIFKSAVLNELGLNVNLAPVVDVVTSPDAYMYERSLKQNTEKTSEYAKAVIESSKNTKVSYTLKHFPGYGNNSDTHVSESIDTRTLEDLEKNDFPPFISGISAGAEAILVSHNIVTNIDSDNPASLSKSIHNLLRNQLKFTGVIITDDIDMSATQSIENKAVQALLAGNDLLITTNYEATTKEIKDAIANQMLSEATINNAALRVLAWKYYKGIMIEKEK